MITGRPDPIMEIGDGFCIMDQGFDFLVIQALRAFVNQAHSELIQIGTRDVNGLSAAQETDVQTIDVGVNTDLEQTVIFLKLWR